MPISPALEDELLGSSTEIAMAPDDPVVRRDNVVNGFVEESLEDSLARAGLPASLGLQLKERIVVSPRSAPASTAATRFQVRYQQTMAADGREIGTGRIVSAEVMTASGGQDRPLRAFDRPAASNSSGSATANRWPRRRCDCRCDTVSVTSGFGVRADPFEQPRNGLGAPSRLGAVGATINTATARGIRARPGAGAPAAPRARRRCVPDAATASICLRRRARRSLAASDGTIVGAAPNAGYGNWIRIDHGHNVATVRYGLLRCIRAGHRRRGEGPARAGDRPGRQHRAIDRPASSFRGHQQRPGGRPDEVLADQEGEAGRRRSRKLPQARPAGRRRTAGRDAVAADLLLETAAQARCASS